MTETQPDPRLEIAHVLFMDVVGFSKSLINEQSEMLRQLNQVVRDTAQVKAAEAAGKLIRIPTGDGMALGFFTTPDAPLRCAIEISQALKSLPKIPVRMGINSGPVDEIVDVKRALESGWHWYHHGAARHGLRRRWTHPAFEKERRRSRAVWQMAAASARAGPMRSQTRCQARCR